MELRPVILEYYSHDPVFRQTELMKLRHLADFRHAGLMLLRHVKQRVENYRYGQGFKAHGLQLDTGGKCPAVEVYISFKSLSYSFVIHKVVYLPTADLSNPVFTSYL